MFSRDVGWHKWELTEGAVVESSFSDMAHKGKSCEGRCEGDTKEAEDKKRPTSRAGDFTGRKTCVALQGGGAASKLPKNDYKCAIV